MVRTLLLPSAIAMSACGSSTPTPAPAPVSNSAPAPPPDAQQPDEVGAAMRMMESFAKEMCACTSADCAQQVANRITEWSAEQAKGEQAAAKLTDVEEKRAIELGTQMGECMQRAMGMSGP